MTDTPADTIRRAAALMRERAMAATPGPWISLDNGDRILHDPGHDLDPPVYVVDEPISNAANAEHIAALHPTVAQHIADAWDATADDMANYDMPVEHPNGWATASGHWLGVVHLWTATIHAARAYLGGEQQ